MRGMGGEYLVESGELRVKSEELDGEWRVKSGEWREVWGTFAAVAGQSGQATRRGPDSPQGCPAIRPLQMGEYLRPSRDRADRQRAAGRMARKGALQSGSYG